MSPDARSPSRRADELGANIFSHAPNNLVAATFGALVGCKEQGEVIGNFEPVELQPHTAVGKVLTRQECSSPRPKNIAATRPSWWRSVRRRSSGILTYSAVEIL